MNNFKLAALAAILDIETERFQQILNLCVAMMPPISHQVSAQSDLEFRGRCSLKNFKMLSWIPESNDFSSFESLCHCDASHQVSAQSDLGFGRICHLKNFKLVALAAILDVGTERF